MFDPFGCFFEVRSARYFVKIDHGYVEYGRADSSTFERLAHFVERGDPWARSLASLKAWARGLLSEVSAGCRSMK